MTHKENHCIGVLQLAISIKYIVQYFLFGICSLKYIFTTLFKPLLGKFVFSKKATKIDVIFAVNWTLTTYLTVKISSNFVAFLENRDFDCLNYSKVHIFWEGNKDTGFF